MYTRSNLDRLRNDQRNRWHVGLKAFILTYDNISRIMIDKGTLAEYSDILETARRANTKNTQTISLTNVWPPMP